MQVISHFLEQYEIIFEKIITYKQNFVVVNAFRPNINTSAPSIDNVFFMPMCPETGVMINNVKHSTQQIFQMNETPTLMSKQRVKLYVKVNCKVV